MEDCIFCKIVNGEIPSAKVYEDDAVISFLDILPANKGHCLVAPKKHYETLLEIPDDLLAGMIQVAKRITRALSLSIGNGSYNIIMNNGKAAGQLVSHAHFHVIPRFEGDRLRIAWSHKKYTDKEMKSVQEKIKKFV
ncbi:HIT family protein [Candidatus Woesearchaeota archaeon]|nr:HIT family protein [Candidatus Woesearchaeota archaeon]